MDMESTVVGRAEIKKYYNGLVDHSKRIWEMLENQKEMVEVLNNTNEALLNDRMTNIMKTLTIFSVIVLPLNLLTGIFSMNTINTPIIGWVYGFPLIISVMLLCSIGMLLFFARRKWL